MGSVSYSGLSIEVDPTVSAQITALDLVNSTTLSDYLQKSGGTMTGAITFDSVGAQNISKGTFDSSRGGYNGISLTCAVGYEFNWQAGWLTSSTGSGAYPQPIYIDSAFGSPLKVWDSGANTGVQISHTAITFPDGTTQSTAPTGGYNSKKAIANLCAACLTTNGSNFQFCNYVYICCVQSGKFTSGSQYLLGIGYPSNGSPSINFALTTGMMGYSFAETGVTWGSYLGYVLYYSDDSGSTWTEADLVF